MSGAAAAMLQLRGDRQDGKAKRTTEMPTQSPVSVQSQKGDLCGESYLPLACATVIRGFGYLRLKAYRFTSSRLLINVAVPLH